MNIARFSRGACSMKNPLLAIAIPALRTPSIMNTGESTQKRDRRQQQHVEKIHAHALEQIHAGARKRSHNLAGGDVANPELLRCIIEGEE